jgi:hypothetical protein
MRIAEGVAEGERCTVGTRKWEFFLIVCHISAKVGGKMALSTSGHKI